jgi:hypothetical protein
VALGGLAACGTPPPVWEVDAGACAAYVAPPMNELMSPAVSFKADVMPVFGASCASASCHGLTDSPQGGLYLGSSANMVHAALVGTPSAQLPAMPFVAAGDPANSYLMHKLDADQCLFETSCVGHDCQRTMPYDTGALAVEKRDVVRRWIAQGAIAE